MGVNFALFSAHATAVELCPVGATGERELTNYRGYNTTGFLAPDPRSFTTGEIAEFKQVIADLHDAGLDAFRDLPSSTFGGDEDDAHR